MRTRNAITNIKYNMVFYIINSILAFVSKTILINYIGADFTGLNAVLKNILGLLNVVELGIGQSVTYSLFKPLRENNQEKINKLLSFYKKIYRFIGMIIGIASIVVSFFLNEIIHTEVISMSQVRIYFLVYVIMTIFSYFTTYIQILAMADQKEYIVTKVLGYSSIIKIVTQSLSAVAFRSFAIWTAIEFICTISSYLYINRKIFSIYTFIKRNTHTKTMDLFKEHKQIFIDTKNLLYHRIASVAVFQTDSILISAFENLKSVTIYSNYTMITSILSSITGLIFSGIRSGVGDLIAEGDDKKSYTLWKNIYYFTNIAATIIVFCLYVNINSLMNVWLGKDFLFNNSIVLFICINLYIYITRTPTVTFIFCYGLFWDKWAALTEAVVNLIVSLILVKYMGIIGVIIGTFTSNIIIVIIWKPYMLFKYGFKMKPTFYVEDAVKVTIITLISIIISGGLIMIIGFNMSNTVINLIVHCIVSFLFISISYFVVSVFDKKHKEFYMNSISLGRSIAAQKVKE